MHWEKKSTFTCLPSQVLFGGALIEKRSGSRVLVLFELTVTTDFANKRERQIFLAQILKAFFFVSPIFQAHVRVRANIGNKYFQSPISN